MTDIERNQIFCEIYEKTNKQVCTYIAAKCRQTEDVQDIFQETYIEIIRCLEKKGGDYVQSAEGFAIHIARKKIYQHYHIVDRMKSRLQYILDLEKSNHEEKLNIYECKESKKLEEHVITHLLADEIRKIITEKPEIIRKIFYLFYDRDLTIREIAKILNISEANVKNKLYRTLKDIRNLY